MKSKRLEFTGNLGYKLSGLLDLPDKSEPMAFALFAHCFTCNKNYKILNYVNQVLTENKIAVLRFDFTGLGASQGSFSDTNLSSNIGDIICGAEFLDLNYEAPKLLIGHSFGGAAVIYAAGLIKSCQAVVTIAAPSSFDSIRSILMNKYEELQRDDEAVFTIMGRQFRLKKHFLDNLNQAQLGEAIKKLSQAILICQSPRDEVVTFDNASLIFAMANHPKSLLSLDNADHLVSNQKDGRYLGQMIAVWASKYLFENSKLMSIG